MEELDEALQEVWALLHLTLSSFDKVLAKDKTKKKCDVNWILVLSPASGLILLAMTEPWLHTTGQLASPGACDCCLEGLEGTNRKHPTHPLWGLRTSPHTCAAGRLVALAVCPGISPHGGFLLGTWLDPSPSPAWPYVTRKGTFEDASPALMPPTVPTMDPCVSSFSLCRLCTRTGNNRGWAGLGSPGGHGGERHRSHQSRDRGVKQETWPRHSSLESDVCAATGSLGEAERGRRARPWDSLGRGSENCVEGGMGYCLRQDHRGPGPTN